MQKSKRLSAVNIAPLNVTTLLLLMGCAGIGRSGKQDSVTFDPDAASVVSYNDGVIDENETIPDGIVLYRPKVEINAPEVEFSLRASELIANFIEIDPKTGVITTTSAGSINHEDIPAEDESEVKITIVAKFGSQESTQTITLKVNDLNDDAPKFNLGIAPAGIDSSVLEVDENEEFSRDVSAEPDVTGATVEYTLDNDDVFNISSEGILSLKDGNSFNYEDKTGTGKNKNEYKVEITATVGEESSSFTLKLEVQDVNEAPTVNNDATIEDGSKNTLYSLGDNQYQ